MVDTRRAYESLALAAVAGPALIAAGVLCATKASLVVQLSLATLAVVLVVRLRRRVGRLAVAHSKVHIEVLLLPLGIGFMVFDQRLGLVSLTAVCGLSAYRAGSRAPRSRPTVATALLALSGLAVWFPSLAPCFAVVAVIYVVSNCRDDPLPSLVDGVGLYLIASVVAYFFLGLQSPSASARLANSLAATGFFNERIIFPFGQSLITAPALAAAFLAASLPALLTYEGAFSVRSVSVAAALVVLAGADSRSAMATAALLTGFYLIDRRLFAKLAPAIVVVALLLPFGYSFIRAPLESAITEASSGIPALERSKQANDSELNGRDVVWRETLAGYAEFPPSYQLFGYGAQGQISSGLSRRYAHLFRGGFADPASHGSHSTSLQQMVDGGLLGLGSLVVGVALLTHRLAIRARDTSPGSCTFAFVVALAVVGATESIISPGANLLGFCVLLAIACATPALSSKRRAVSPMTSGSTRPQTATGGDVLSV